MNLRFRLLIGISVLVNTIMTVLVAGLIRTTQAELRQMRAEMATREDVVSVAVPSIELSQQGRCDRCHSERRFAGEKNTRRAGISAAAAHMQSLSDAGLTDEQMGGLMASLDLLRCASCHEIDVLRTMVLDSEEERLATIRRCIARPGSNISPDKAEDILRAYRIIVQR